MTKEGVRLEDEPSKAALVPEEEEPLFGVCVCVCVGTK